MGKITVKKGNVDVLIPHIAGMREEGLEKCVDSIKKQSFKGEIRIHIIQDAGENTVPEKVRLGVEQSENEYIVFAANDMVFDRKCIENAIKASKVLDKSLVAFNEGPVYPDLGNVATHWIIRRDFLPKLEDGLAFHTDFSHYGCDNFLHAQADKLGEFHWCEEAIITHNHYSKGAEFDEIYKKACVNIEKDRETLRQKLATL